MKQITVKLPNQLYQHCKKRINQLKKTQEMDMSKFIRQLIREDCGVRQSTIHEVQKTTDTTEGYYDDLLDLTRRRR